MPSDLMKLYNRRKAREWYYRQKRKEGKTVRPYKTYETLPLTQKQRAQEMWEEMDEKAKEWLRR